MATHTFFLRYKKQRTGYHARRYVKPRPLLRVNYLTATLTRGPTRLKSRTPSVEIQPEIRNPKRNPEIQQEI